MSGAQTSTFTNQLFDPLMAGRQQLQQNALAQGQQTINENEMEQASRAANWIISQDPENKDPAKQAQSYTAALRILRANNFALKSPDQYPGFEAMQYLARSGTPSADQFKLGQAGTAIPKPDFGPGAAAPGGGGGGAGTTVAAPGTIEPEAVSRANAVRDGLMKRGLDYDTATAFAANALHESSANPNTGAGDAGASHGLFQWRGDRYDRYLAKYGHSPDNAPLDEQLDYVLDELNGPESLAKGRIAQAQGPEGKAAQVSEAFLRPKDVAAEMARRSATAKQLAALGPAPATPGMTDQQWLANQGRQYPSLASAGAGTPGVVPPAPGGGVAARYPGAVQAAGPAAGATPAAPQAPPAPVTTIDPETQLPVLSAPPNQVMPGQPNGPPAAPPPPAAPAAPPPAAIAHPAIAPVAIPAPDRMDNHHLTARDYEDLNRARASGATGPQLNVMVQQRQQDNDARQEKYYGDVRQAQNDAQAANERAIADARAAETQRLAQVTSQREQEAAAALAEQRRIENKRQQEAADRDAQRLAQGSTQADKDTYTLTHDDPSSQQYAEAWSRKKWEVAPNGNVIEKDVSEYRAPTRSIQRPSFLPAPTPQGLDEARKADVDAKVITSAIDHYTDVFEATGGGGWDAYFANPKDPKTQQLLGAFDRMKTVLRSPQYYNTGVLQPAEIKLMGEDLVSPQSLRGVFATPQALATRLGEIKLAVLTRQDAELRSVGRPGVIVRDKTDFAQVPIGGRYYDEEGHLHVRKD